MIYNGYPQDSEQFKKVVQSKSKNNIFYLYPLKSHIFDPSLTGMINSAKLRNNVMVKIINLLSLSCSTGRRGNRGKISYSSLGISQLGAVYEALLSYSGIIAKEKLYEVRRPASRKSSSAELEISYFIPERELGDYSDDERVRHEAGPDKGELKSHEKGAFIYRLAGRDREKSASYYTPEPLARCLVKYALKDLLEVKTADDILSLKIWEPAMGSATFLNEAVSQLADAYLERKERETAITIYDRDQELQKVKMFIADRNVFGIDINPVAVELAEVSLWLNSIFEGGFVPWFGTQLKCGNSIIGAGREVYHSADLIRTAGQAAPQWWKSPPTRIAPGAERGDDDVYHFLLGDPGMSKYDDKVIKNLLTDELNKIKMWNKDFIKPYSSTEINTITRLSRNIDQLFSINAENLILVDEKTTDPLSIYGRIDDK